MGRLARGPRGEGVVGGVLLHLQRSLSGSNSAELSTEGLICSKNVALLTNDVVCEHGWSLKEVDSQCVERRLVA